MNETRKPMTLHRLRKMPAEGEKIAMLTCYDAGVDVLLVGDSLGMVLQGHGSTGPVSLAPWNARDIVNSSDPYRSTHQATWLTRPCPSRPRLRPQDSM
jgi:hypothetical protein